MICTLNKLNLWVERAELLVITTLLMILTVILSSQVVLRYLFNDPIFWAEEASSNILISMSFIGLSILISRRDLVSVDLFVSQVPEGMKKVMLLALDSISLMTLMLLCYYSTVWISRPEVRMEMSPTTGLPQWYSYIFLVISVYLMLWHQLVNTINSIYFSDSSVCGSGDKLNVNRDT